MQLTMVSDVPLVFSGAFCAIKEENIGESAITKMPQRIKNIIKRYGLEKRNSGDSKQHTPDENKETTAIFFGLKCCDKSPATTHDKAPHPMTINEVSATLRLASGF